MVTNVTVDVRSRGFENHLTRAKRLPGRLHILVAGGQPTVNDFFLTMMIVMVLAGPLLYNQVIVQPAP